MFFPGRRDRFRSLQAPGEQGCRRYACCGGLPSPKENEDALAERLGSLLSSTFPVVKPTTLLAAGKRKNAPRRFALARHLPKPTLRISPRRAASTRAPPVNRPELSDEMAWAF